MPSRVREIVITGLDVGLTWFMKTIPIRPWASNSAFTRRTSDSLNLTWLTLILMTPRVMVIMTITIIRIVTITRPSFLANCLSMRSVLFRVRRDPVSFDITFAQRTNHDILIQIVEKNMSAKLALFQVGRTVETLLFLFIIIEYPKNDNKKDA